MEKPAFEVNINGIIYNIFADGRINWIMINGQTAPAIGTIINRIPQLIEEAREEGVCSQL